MTTNHTVAPQMLDFWPSTQSHGWRSNGHGKGFDSESYDRTRARTETCENDRECAPQGPQAELRAEPQAELRAEAQASPHAESPGPQA